MSTVYMIPTVLDEHSLETILPYILFNLKKCNVIFAENERTARRFFKALDQGIVIDDFEWYPIHKAEEEQKANFRKKIAEKKTIAIVSEAGCPGVADPGQLLVAVAQELNCKVIPLVGPNSILLALMASGMNGQNFEFTGYLPIDNAARDKMIRELESDSSRSQSTKIFIETPYRNNQLMESLTRVCQPKTRLCVAVNLTGAAESIHTRTIFQWKQHKTDIHKQPAIFLLNAGLQS